MRASRLSPLPAVAACSLPAAPSPCRQAVGPGRQVGVAGIDRRQALAQHGLQRIFPAGLDVLDASHSGVRDDRPWRCSHSPIFEPLCMRFCSCSRALFLASASLRPIAFCTSACTSRRRASSSGSDCCTCSTCSCATCTSSCRLACSASFGSISASSGLISAAASVRAFAPAADVEQRALGVGLVGFLDAQLLLGFGDGGALGIDGFLRRALGLLDQRQPFLLLLPASSRPVGRVRRPAQQVRASGARRRPVFSCRLPLLLLALSWTALL